MSVNAFGGTSTKVEAPGITASQLNTTFLRLDGANKVTSNLDVNSKKIVNLATPTSLTDAASKSYVDTQDALKADKTCVDTQDALKASKTYVDTQDALKLSLAGGSMTGNLTMSGTTEVMQATAPSTSNSLCNKTYVDKKLPLTGGTMTGHLNMGGVGRVISLVDPINNQDAATKFYVDTSKLDITGGSMSGNITMGSTTEIFNPKAPSTSNSLCNKTYVDTKLPLAGGTVTGHITMNSLYEIYSPKAPSSGNAVCNKTYVDTQVGTRLPLAGGSVTGSITMADNIEIFQSALPSMPSSLCNRDFVDTLFSTGTKLSDMKVAMGSATSRSLGVVDVTSRPTTGSKTVKLELGNDTSSHVTSTIGTSSDNSNVTIASPGKTLFTNSYGSDTTQVQSLSLEMVSSDKAKMTVSGDAIIKFGSSSSLSFGCDDIAANKIITFLLGDSSNKITYQPKISPNNPLTLDSSYGLMVNQGVNGCAWFGSSVGDNRMYMPLNMNTNKVTNIATPTSDTDAVTKAYVDTMIPVFKTATGTLGNVGQDTVFLQCTSAKNPQNGKILVGKAWIERTTGEWFSCETYYVSSTFAGSFQFFYRASTMRVCAYFGTKPTGWTCNYRLDYLEFP